MKEKVFKKVIGIVFTLEKGISLEKGTFVIFQQEKNEVFQRKTRYFQKQTKTLLSPQIKSFIAKRTVSYSKKKGTT